MPTTKEVGQKHQMNSVSSSLFIREQLDHLGIRHYELAQYEADDIIGTLDKMAETSSVPFEVTIVSGDKDLIQLTDDNTVVEIPKKG